MRVHSDVRRHFECVDCAKQFNHEQSLKQHIDIIHIDLLDELGENLEASEEKEDAAMEETSFNKSKKDFIRFIKKVSAPEKSKEAAPPVPMEEDGPLRTVRSI